MNMIKKIKLTKIPNFDDDLVVTRCGDGSPLSHIYDNYWDYSGIEKKASARRSALKIPFHTIDCRFRKGIQSTLWYVSEKYKNQHKTTPTASQITSWVRGLKYICAALESSDWAVLSDDRVYKQFEKKLVRHIGGSVTSINLTKGAINLLNRYNLCHRDVDGNDFKRKFQPKTIEQRIAIPIAMYQVALSEAIRSIEKYHKHRHEISRVMDAFYEIYAKERADTTKSQESGSLSERVHTRVKKIKHNIPDFKPSAHGSDVGKIMNQCMIVVLAFSGVRNSELLSLSKDSYKTKIANGNEVPIITGETTKGHNGTPVVTTWQTHPIAKDALELAFDMTENLREWYKLRINEQLNDGTLTVDNHKAALDEVEGAFIPTCPSSVTTFYTRTGFSRIVKKLFKSITASQVDVDEFNLLNPSRVGQLKVGGTLPSVAPHDFRRTFAVFFKRYGFGSASTIKFQYKHANINMSDYYANNASLQAMEDTLLDADLLQIMHEEGICMAVDAFDEVYNKSEVLSGIEGERIAKDKYEMLKNGHDVYMTRSEIEVLVRNGSLSVVKLPTGGYCTNATCSRICGIAQFSAEKKPCDHQIITDSQAKVILRQNNRLIKTFRALNTGDPLESSNLIALKQKIKRNEITIQKHRLKFELFDDDVKGIIVTQEA